MVRICQPRRSWSAPKWTVAILTLMRNQSPPTTRHGISKHPKTAALGQDPPLSSTMDDPDAVETGAEPISADLRHYRLDPLADRRGAGVHLDIPSPPSVMRTSSN